MLTRALDEWPTKGMVFVVFILNFILFSDAQRICCPKSEYFLSSTVSIDHECAIKAEMPLNCSKEDTLVRKLLHVNETLPNITSILNNTSYSSLNDYCLGLSPSDGLSFHTVFLLICRENSTITDSETQYCDDVECRFFAYVEEMLKLVSTILLLVTIGIYTLLRKLRDLQGSCILNFLICYIFVYVIVYDVLHFEHLTESYNLCPTVGYVFYFFTLSSFGWLCISAFNAWKNLLPWNTHYMKTYIFYLIFIYGITGLCLATIMIIQYYGHEEVKPNFLITQNKDCWFESDNQEWLWFFLPIESCLLVAAVFLFDSSCRAWRIYVRTVDCTPEVKMLIKNYYVSFKLYLIIGSTWIMSFLSKKTSSPGNLQQLLISIQGILVFIGLVLTEKRIMKALSNSEYYSCSLFPTKWTPIQSKNSGEPRYYSRNDNLGDVDLTLPPQRKTVVDRRHTSSGL